MKIPPKSKKAMPPPPAVASLVSSLLNAQDEELAAVLKDIDTWKWPRTDLNAWIKVLNRFDDVMDSIIREYDVEKLQLVPFSETTKELLSGILRFERLLLEYSTNRKTFSSYDRLNNLLSSADLEIVILALNVLLRPSQQYSSQQPVSHLSISTSRLQSLAKRWPHLREHGIGLLELASDQNGDLKNVPPEAREVNFTFYNTETTPTIDKKPETVPDSSTGSPRKANISAPGMSSDAVQLHLDERTITSQSVMNVLADAIQTHSVPDSEAFELLCRIRAAASLASGKKADRENLLIIRLLAIGIYGHTHSETQATSALFLYEPDLIAHIAELLQSDKGVPIPVQTAAIAALDALARYKSKVQEVLTAVNAGVNHGILLALVRNMVVEVADPNSKLPHSFIEALLSFITYLASHASGGNMVVSAGLIPLLVQIVENKNPNRLPVISKTMQLLDNVIYSFSNAFPLFCASRGVEILVERIEHEIDLDIKNHATGHQPYALSGLGELPIKRVAVLKHILRSMHRMMQSSGTAEGLRSLIDTSLLKSIKKIVEYRGLFGSSVFPLAVNIMSSFVHNEPTSLAIIQESGLPSMFYQAIENGIEPAIEVIQAIPNAIGALCLNDVGQAQLANHPSIIPAIISIFTSESHLKVLIDKENAVIIGTAVDELIRHHPSLKQAVFEALKSTLNHLENIGMAYTSSDDIKRWYQLLPLSEVHLADVDVTMQDLTSSPEEGDEPSPAAAEGLDQSDDQEEPEEKSHVNDIVNYIDVLGRFLDGFFQHPVHCRDFVLNTDGLKRIGRLTALPCLPYDFANNVASDSMVQVLRTMAEVATNETLSQLIAFVKESLNDTRFLWDSEQSNSKLLPLVDVSEEKEVDINQQFRNLVTLYIRITLLSDVFATVGQPQSRATAGLWQTLMNSIPRQVLADLGALHRAGAWESSTLGAGLREKGIELPEYGVGLDEGIPSLVPAIVPVTDGPTASTSATANEGNISLAATSPVTSKGPAAKEGGPQDWNAAALTRIIQGIPNTLAPFFQAIVKMFHSRRNTDSVHKKQIIETSKVVADVMLRHINIRDHLEDKISPFSYYSSLLNLVGRLFIDDRTPTSTLHTVQIFAFYQVGGFDGFFDICASLISDIDDLVKISEEARSVSQKKQLLQAFGTIELMLQLVHPIISAKTLFDSAQTTVVITRDKRETDADYFEPHNFLVKLRFAALPTVRRLWESSWLAEAPVGVSRYVVRCMLEIVNGENEDSKSDSNGDGGPVPPVIPRAGPSEAHIRLLTDMGFPRSAVERALAHANNDVNSATEYLLSLPFPLPPDPEPVNFQAESTMEEAMSTEESPEASGSNSDTGGSPSPTIDEDANPTTASLGKGSDEWRKLLDEARESLMVNISKRSLSLIDEHLSLLFDLHIVFTKGSKHQEQAIRNLVDDISSFSNYAYDLQEQPLANRCRLLALVLCEKPSSLEPDLRNTLMERLLALLLTTRNSEHPPKWLAAHLLVTEALFTLADEPRTISAPKEGETIVAGPIAVGPPCPEARSIVFDFCLQLLTNDDLPADELLSVLRLFVLLTRDRQMAAKFVDLEGLSSLFRRLRKSAVTGGSSYVASVLRHVAEDIPIIQGIMQRNIKGYLSQTRRIVDLPTYVKNCSAIALRDMDLFINVTNNLCLVENPYSSPHIKFHPGVQPTDKDVASGEISTDMQTDNPPTSASCSVPNKSVETVIHLLVNEVMNTTKSINESPSSAPPLDPDSSPARPDIVGDSATCKVESTDQATPPIDAQDRHQYLCFVMQCLTELLFSYDSCKVAFLSYSSKKRPQPSQTKDTKFRTTTLHFLLSDIITYSTINPTSDTKYRNRAALCSWAMNVVGALCMDTSATHETKEISSDLLMVRKFVLETISRAIKEISTTTENTEARYGRLLALADLCHRLLTVRVHPNTRKQQQDDVPTHLAKIMLEKNFVATLTNALSEVDLNYPNVRNLVASVLRPLEYLTKIAMKMSKSSGKNKEDVTQDEAQSSASEDEDEDMDDGSPREETPDLYRNSALGMYGGEMDDRAYTDDEDMDHEDTDQNVEMDYGEGTGSEETSASEAESDDEGDEDSPVSGVGWNEEDEEDEEGLIQHRDDEDEEEEAGHVGDEDPDNEDDERDEEEDDAGMIWEDVQQPHPLGMILENGDEEQGLGVSIQINHEGDEPELASDEEDLLGQGHLNNDDMIELGNAVITAASQGPGLFIQRRFPRSFGRSRNAPSAPETITHPLLLDASTQNRSNVNNQNRNLRNPQRFISNGAPPNILQALDQVFGDGSLQAIQHFVHQGAGFGGMFHIQLGTTLSQPRRFIPGSARQERTPRSNSHRQGREFDPLNTIQRWGEEMRILHGDFVNERANKLTNHLLVAMLPAALEAQRQAKAKAQEEAKRKEEEEKEKEKENREAEEEAKKAKILEEDAHDAEGNTSDAVQESAANPTVAEIVTEQSSATEQLSATDQSSATEPITVGAIQEEVMSENSHLLDAVMEGTAPAAQLDQDSEMADVTGSAPEATSQELSQPSSGTTTNRAARITVTIHGSAVDITDTGIDPTFLEALPDDMREEVLNQHVRDQEAARLERPPDSLISAEFLDALPPDIRAEIIQQETMERSRRRTEESTTRAPVREAAEIDPASFIASLDPSLRQAVLLDQDDTFLQTLPAHMIAEVDVYRDELQARRSHARIPVRPIPTAPTVKKYTQHDAIMLLDRAGVAILVRLLFYPQVLKKSLLFKVLVNLCENLKTRTELFNLLLSILQDGTGDVTAVDKSFAQMTVKSRESKLQIPKAKQRPTDAVPPFGMQISQMEAVPDLIAQRCLEALTYIVNANEPSSLFFLTEQEMSGLRKLSTKKGKGKEKQISQTHYPLVLLLNLLDRETLLRPPAILESVVGLLATITRPLANLKEPSKLEDNVAQPSLTAQDSENTVDNQSSPSTRLPEATDGNIGDTAPPEEPAAPPPEQTPNSINKPDETEAKNPLKQAPHVPHTALRLIVNILTIGECSSRTFQQSLALIQNLSYIPDGRDVIALELKTKAQECGLILSSDLDELAIALQDGQSQIASSVAAKFSAASSTQAKLLRVLKTIDYMYTPKPATVSAVGTPASKEDVEKVQAIYESFRFTPLWRRLGDCLSSIGENPETEHIATVLLPLIESLMVVCKFVGSKTPIPRALRSAASPLSPTTAKEAMEDLFISFTDAHRKILNLMVRNNPSLMSGSFSLLVNNSRVLDFDNKRNYFNQQLHRRPHIREHYGTLQLNVRRARVFEDSFLYLQRKTGEQIKYGKLSVRFYDEEGVDAGGLTREWFQILARQMFNPNYALFQPCAADKLTYQPNKASWVNPEHLSFFKFVGRVIGKAIYDGRLLDAYFARSLYRQILGKPVDYRDVEWVDPEYYNSLCWILVNDPTPLELFFSIEADEFGVNKIVPLKEKGENTQVTQENKREYVQLSAQYRLYSSIKEQIESLLGGFYEIIPKDLITIFNEQELELLISGTPDIDVDEWRAATEYNGYTASDPNIVWWWRALKSFNREERAKVLSFATGTSRVPLNGFLDLQGVQGVQKFSIHRAYGDPDRLPQAHTCFNQIDLPQYTSYEMLRQQLLLAINEGGEGFGFS